jgi:hypothetical protein
MKKHESTRKDKEKASGNEKVAKGSFRYCAKYTKDV